MKRFLSVLVALCLLLGCMSLSVAVAAEEQVTIRISWWGGQARNDNTVKALEDFMSKNPGIKVEYEFAGYGDHFTKLATQAAGGMLPDVIQMDYVYLKQYADNGVLADMTPYIQSGALDMTNIAESSIASGKVGEGLYGMPTGTNAKVLAYRPDVLAEAGLTMPMEPTMSEYFTLLEQVYEKTGRTNAYLWPSLSNGLNFILRNYGLSLYNEDNTALGFDDPKYLLVMWEQMLDGMEKGYDVPVDEYAAIDTSNQLDIDTWCTWIDSNLLGTYETGSNCELELAMIPQMDDATQASTFFKPNMLWSVTDTSEQKDAAIALVNYFTNDVDCFDINGMDRGLPISSAIREQLAPTLDPSMQKVVDMLNYLAEEGNTSQIDAPDASCHNDVNSLYAQICEEIRYGLISREELPAAAQRFIDEANAIIARSLQK